MKTRDELIEVMARAAVVHRFGDGADDHQCGEGGDTRSEWTLRTSDMEAILIAIEAAGAVVVPKVATDEMLDEVCAADGHEPFTHETIGGCYTAMLDASPFRPVEGDG